MHNDQIIIENPNKPQVIENLISPSNYNNHNFTPPLNIGVLASGNGSNLEAIFSAINRGELQAYISLLIVNDPCCNARRRAEKLGIDCIVIDHMNYNSREQHEEAIIKSFSNYNVELVVMAGWMRIVTSLLIKKYKSRLINIHPSLLPSFKGKDAIRQAMSSKVAITGCTVHIVDLEVDSGPIIMQSAVPIKKDDDEEKIRERIQAQEHIILPKSIAIVGSIIRDIVN